MATTRDDYLARIAVEVQNDKALQKLVTDMNKAAKAAPNAGKQVQAASKHTARFGNVAQNTGYQLQDMIVQVQGGVDPLRALSQQLPQMLTGLGAMGAAIGVVAAAAPAMVQMFTDTEAGAVGAEKALEQAAEAWGDYADSLERVEESGNEADVVIARILGRIARSQQDSALAAMRADAQDMVSGLVQIQQVVTQPASTESSWLDGVMSWFREARDIGAGSDLAGLSKEVREIQQTHAEGNRFGGVENFERFNQIITQMNAGNLQQTIVQLGELLETMRGGASPEVVSWIEDFVVQLQGMRTAASDAVGQLEEIQVKAERWTSLPRSQYGVTPSQANFLEGARTVGEIDDSNDLPAQFDAWTEATVAFERSWDSMVNGLASGTQTIDDAVQGMVQSVVAQLGKLAAEWLANQAIRALFGSFTANAQGNVIDGGKVTAFASGGVVNGPTVFPMANGMGLMGEAGPEAIMPLKRTANGDLGVQASPVNVVVNNNAAGVEVKTRQTSEGLTLEIVEQHMAGRIARGGSPVSDAIEGSYGVSRGRGAR